jgi:hypothetical protein
MNVQFSEHDIHEILRQAESGHSFHTLAWRYEVPVDTLRLWQALYSGKGEDEIKAMMDMDRKKAAV